MKTKQSDQQPESAVASSVRLGVRLIFFTNCLTCLVCIIGVSAYKTLSVRVAKLEKAALSGPSNQLRRQAASTAQPRMSTRAMDAVSQADLLPLTFLDASATESAQGVRPP